MCIISQPVSKTYATKYNHCFLPFKYNRLEKKSISICAAVDSGWSANAVIHVPRAEEREGRRKKRVLDTLALIALLNEKERKKDEEKSRFNLLSGTRHLQSGIDSLSSPSSGCCQSSIAHCFFFSFPNLAKSLWSTRRRKKIKSSAHHRSLYQDR